MPVLVLARHAKAEPLVSDGRDVDRPLAPRGRDHARELGASLGEAGFTPDVAYVSDALRTAQTWDLAAAAWEVPEVHRRPELYATTVGTLVEILRRTPPGAGCVMVVGHEPTMSATVQHLAGRGSLREVRARVALGLSTGTAAVLEVDGEWSDLGRGCARLKAIVGRAS